MEAYHISAFIDDELSLDEKIDFVETVHDNKAFKKEAVQLLHQEKQLRDPVVDQVLEMPRLASPSCRPLFQSLFIQWGFCGWGVAAAMLLVVIQVWRPAVPTISSGSSKHRFLIYQPEAESAALVGSFSNWQALHMRPGGTSGYWEITLDLPPGEHRYGFLLDGNRHVVDPTSPVSELDDFGGVNSIITIQSDSIV